MWRCARSVTRLRYPEQDLESPWSPGTEQGFGWVRITDPVEETGVDSRSTGTWTIAPDILGGSTPVLGMASQTNDRPPTTRHVSETGRFRYNAQARVEYVEDGDTWFGRHMPDPTLVVATDANHRDDANDTDGQYYRLSRVDTHETDADDPTIRERARAEKRFTEQFVDTGRTDYAGSWPFVTVYESTDTKGTFGRRLVNLIRKQDGKELNDALLAEFGDDIRYDPSM